MTAIYGQLQRLNNVLDTAEWGTRPLSGRGHAVTGALSLNTRAEAHGLATDGVCPRGSDGGRGPSVRAPEKRTAPAACEVAALLDAERGHLLGLNVRVARCMSGAICAEAWSYFLG